MKTNVTFKRNGFHYLSVNDNALQQASQVLEPLIYFFCCCCCYSFGNERFISVLFPQKQNGVVQASGASNLHGGDSIQSELHSFCFRIKNTLYKNIEAEISK